MAHLTREDFDAFVEDLWKQSDYLKSQPDLIVVDRATFLNPAWRKLMGLPVPESGT